MTAPNPQNSYGGYLQVDFNLPKEPEKRTEIINERERRTASIVNTKDNGTYQIAGLIPGAATVENSELQNCQQFFTQPAANAQRQGRYVYRSGFDLVSLNSGVIVAGMTTTVAHGLSAGGGTFTFTRIYGTATNGSPAFLPLPYASPTLNLNIELKVTTSNIIIIVGAGQTNLTQCWVILEYLKA